MLAAIRHTITNVQRQIHKFFFPQIGAQLSLAGIPLDNNISLQNNANIDITSVLEESLWFAVPKSKISRSKVSQKLIVHNGHNPPLDLGILCSYCGTDNECMYRQHTHLAAD